MNKKFKFIFLMSFILLFCSACDGDVTRDLRHDGFNYGSEFNCKYFFPADKEDTSYKKINLTGWKTTNVTNFGYMFYGYSVPLKDSFNDCYS